MAFDWKSLLGTVAPSIATALGGPLAGLATKGIIGALGLGPDAGEAEISAALAGATPDQLLAIKKADQQFTLDMERLGVDLEQIAAGDRNSARQREIHIRDKIPGVIAVLTVGGFFLILGAMSWGLVSGNVTKSEAFLIMLGVLGAMTKDIYSYYFGSSAGSRSKDDTIKKLSA
jgi:hypothetical protein